MEIHHCSYKNTTTEIFTSTYYFLGLSYWPRGLRRSLVVARLLDFVFESRWGQGRVSVVRFVCSKVEVSAPD